MISFYFILLGVGICSALVLLFKENKKEFNPRRNHLSLELRKFFDYLDKFDQKLDTFLGSMLRNVLNDYKNRKHFPSIVPVSFPQSSIQVQENKQDGFKIMLHEYVTEPILETILKDEDGNWKIKYERLVNMLHERGEELEKIQKALFNELKNRGEFENIRNLLERQIDHDKTRNQQLQFDLASVKLENQNLHDRIVQLIDQVSKKDSELEEHKRNTVNLLQQIQYLNTRLLRLENSPEISLPDKMEITLQKGIR